MAKALYPFPTTSDLRQVLESAANLRRICGFRKYGDRPSEAPFSRNFAEFAAGSLGCCVHEAVVDEYLSEQLIGHISRDSLWLCGQLDFQKWQRLVVDKQTPVNS